MPDAVRLRSLAVAWFDLIAAALSFVLSMMIRLGDDFSFSLSYVALGLPIFTFTAAVIFASMRLHRASWRYASLHDLLTIARAVSLAVLVFALVMFFVTRLDDMPRAALVINWMLLMLLLGAPRLAFRAWHDGSLKLSSGANHHHGQIPVLLIGNPASCEQFIREQGRNRHALFRAVGIITSDHLHHGRTIHGVPVYGDLSAMDAVLRKLIRRGTQPQKIICADETTSPEALRSLLATAKEHGLSLARLPRRDELRPGIEDTQTLKPIVIEDLLGRAQNVHDHRDVRRFVSGKTVLITGAGGTIGSELTRQIATYAPAKLVIAELSEFHLYQIEREIRARHPGQQVTFILCDVRDSRHVDHVFSQHKPDIVIHAAAIKHVPMAEFNIEEAILTNVMGTRNIAEAAVKHGAGTMLMISTDKAVNPTNVMGATKRLAESYCQAMGSLGQTRFVTVRFGNVLGSTGSVVPLFQEQIARGGPVTVTHPDITRYFMTVREAVELVLQAATLGTTMKERNECIFVLDMGQPMKIKDLAEQMIRLAGLTPGKDIEISYTGLRPGEKLYEELFHGGENALRTEHQSIFLASPRGGELASLRNALKTLVDAAQNRDKLAALAQLKALVPEFTHDPRYPAL